MFNLQGSELIIILLLALVVLGPEKLPDAMRKAGQFYAELKKMSSSFQQEFRSVVDEPAREVRDTANMLRDSADFRAFRDGDRGEKPKSAEMLAPADPDSEPLDATPSFESVTDDSDGVEAADAAGSASNVPSIPPPPRPFSASQQSSAAPRRLPDAEVESGSPGVSTADAEDAAASGTVGAADATGDEPAREERAE